MGMLWEKFQWILPLCMKSINCQSKTSVVCSATTAVFIDFCLKTLNVFSQHIGQETNIHRNSIEQITGIWNVTIFSVLITSLMMQQQPVMKIVNGAYGWAHIPRSAPYHWCVYKHSIQFNSKQFIASYSTHLHSLIIQKQQHKTKPGLNNL